MRVHFQDLGEAQMELPPPGRGQRCPAWPPWRELEPGTCTFAASVSPFAKQAALGLPCLPGTCSSYLWNAVNRICCENLMR